MQSVDAFLFFFFDGFYSCQQSVDYNLHPLSRARLGCSLAPPDNKRGM